MPWSLDPAGLVPGVRAYPLNIPRTARHHALQCRKKLVAIYLGELEEKKKQNGVEINDLMDGLMQIRDEEDNKLSDQEVLDNIVGLVIARYESTSLASMWSICYLAKFPKAMKHRCVSKFGCRYECRCKTLQFLKK
ncbi:beta-amyrin 11-oxidase-like [Castanea sativa]|uniref:beta-amyrin 11-oxidase-like n=1 Tax=Castanea sativa TaxID=21020 RepID=UPI003F6502F5